jgi:serine/threonine-protein kinase
MSDVPTSDDDEGPAAPLRSGEADPLLGVTIAEKYLVLRRVGTGGMSTVYEVRHVLLGRSFALKVVRANFEDGVRAAARFRREVMVIASVESDHVVAPVDCGVLPDNTPYVVMELLRGQSLRALLEAQPEQPVERAVALMLDVCRGVQAAHDEGIVHRDLKPENVYVVQRSDGRESCKVLDFGIAKLVGSDTSKLTSTGAPIGTVHYMAPEQARGDVSLDFRCDVFAIGAMLYEALAGRKLRGDGPPVAVLYRALHETPTSLDALRSDLPPGLVACVGKATATQPSDRHSSVEELATELLRFAPQGTLPIARLRPAASHPELLAGANTSAPVAVAQASVWRTLTRSRRTALMTLSGLAAAGTLGFLLARSGAGTSLNDATASAADRASAGPPPPAALGSPSLDSPRPTAPSTVSSSPAPAPSGTVNADPRRAVPSSTGAPQVRRGAGPLLPKPRPTNPTQPRFEPKNPYEN